MELPAGVGTEAEAGVAADTGAVVAAGADAATAGTAAAGVLAAADGVDAAAAAARAEDLCLVDDPPAGDCPPRRFPVSIRLISKFSHFVRKG